MEKNVFFNEEPCICGHALIDLNSEYPFMNSLNKYAGSCNVLSPKIWKQKKQKT